MPTLLILAPDAEGFRRYFAGALPELNVIVPRDDSHESLRVLVQDADFILAWRFAPGLLRETPRLRWIQSFGAGVDHLLTENIPATVAITRIVEAFGPAMAEYVLGYCYATTLDIRRVLEHHRRKQWKPFSPQLLQGRTAVVLGLGSIGR